MNNYGRRKFIMGSDIVMIIGCIFCVIPSTVCFGIGRFITGVISGCFAVISPCFVNETSPDEMISTVGTLIQNSTVVGLVFAYGLALPLPTDNYENDSFNEW